MRRVTSDRILGFVCVTFALVIIFVWVPVDAGSGVAEKVRRKWEIGDGLAPSFAGALLGLAGLMLLLGRGSGVRLTGGNALWLLCLLAGLIASLALMRWAGPLATALLDAGAYRPLRDTAPWKWIGYALGGTALVTCLICAVERRFSWRALAVGFGAAAAMIVLYDLPFDDLLLPPNADV